MEEEILPQFVRCFTEDSQDRHGGGYGGGGGSEGPAQLAELLEIGRDKAPTECAWLMAHVREIKAVVEALVSSARWPGALVLGPAEAEPRMLSGSSLTKQAVFWRFGSGGLSAPSNAMADILGLRLGLHVQQYDAGTGAAKGGGEGGSTVVKTEIRFGPMPILAEYPIEFADIAVCKHTSLSVVPSSSPALAAPPTPALAAPSPPSHAPCPHNTGSCSRSTASSTLSSAPPRTASAAPRPRSSSSTRRTAPSRT